MCRGIFMMKIVLALYVEVDGRLDHENPGN